MSFISSMLHSPAWQSTSLLLLTSIWIARTSCFPQPRLSFSSSDFRNTEHKTNGWSLDLPSMTLHNWSIKMMSQPSIDTTAISNLKPGLMREAWPFPPDSTKDSLERGWSSDWSPPSVGMVKRNMVVADDAAFREKSKLLTSLERQKWLNSYMQKLLVVKSQ